MNNIIVRGSQEFLGIEIPVIEGGFSEGQKVVLAKTVAEIHEQRLDKVNELINNNIDEFEEGIDFLDLKVTLGKGYNFEELGFNKMQVAKAKNIYLLSEQGYMALVSLMRTDKAKKLRKQFRREYFTMREVIKENRGLKERLLLQLFSNDALTVANAHKQLVELETKPLIDKIEEDKPKVALAETRLDKGKCISITDATKSLKLKRGQITKWAKSNGYIHKTLTEINKKGEDYFKIYETNSFKCIGITEEGLKLINDNLEEIKNM